MSDAGEPRVYEVRARGWTDEDDVVAQHEPVARLLCPDEWHTGPCEVPWSLGHDEEGTALVVGILASRDKAAEIAERVSAFLGDEHPVTVREADPELFEELIEQYRHERS